MDTTIRDIAWFLKTIGSRVEFRFDVYAVTIRLFTEYYGVEKNMKI